MARSANLFSSLFLIFVSILQTAAVQTCPKTNTCSLTGSLAVRFPFQLTDHNDNHDHDHDQSRCGYPGFNLSCNYNNGEAIILLPSGDFAVRNIFYDYQMLTIDDPEKCLPRRFLEKNFTVSGTPFSVRNFGSFTFLNCSLEYVLADNLMPVPCLSGDGYMVAAGPTVLFESTPLFCEVLLTALVPVISSNRWWAEDWGFHLKSYVMLTWGQPSCGDCEMRGGDCGFVGDAGLQIGCFNLPRHGISKGTQYTLFFVGGLAIIGFLCFNCPHKCHMIRRGISNISGAVHRSPGYQLSNREVVLPSNIIVEVNPNSTSYIGVTGLDATIIETYPKTLVGAAESSARRLLKSNNYSACPICLSEYQPKDTLRTLPDCFHYFHSHCIDEWLRLNATCPLCRNSPQIPPHL